MRRWISYLILTGLAGAWAERAWAEAGPYAGEWAYQALNSKDTHFKVEHKGREILLYRILFPDPAGDPSYRLEHLYKGRIEQKRVTGKMFVRERALDDFEFLRAFSGEIVGQDRMVIDDLPLERSADSSQPDSLSTITRVTIQREGQATEKKPAAKPNATPLQAAGNAPGKGAEAPRAIPSLIPVAMKIPIETVLKVETLIQEADKLFESKQYQEAATRYLDALRRAPQKVEVLYKLGWSYGTLGSLAERNKDTKGAAVFFRLALEYWEKTFRYDPYNQGTKENIRRAKERLNKIQ